MTAMKNLRQDRQNSWVGKNYNVIREIPSRFYNFVVILPVHDEHLIEANDEDFLRLPLDTGIFSFLADPEEDIYTESDGTKIEG